MGGNTGVLVQWVGAVPAATRFLIPQNQLLAPNTPFCPNPMMAPILKIIIIFQNESPQRKHVPIKVGSWDNPLPPSQKLRLVKLENLFRLKLPPALMSKPLHA